MERVYSLVLPVPRRATHLAGAEAREAKTRPHAQTPQSTKGRDAREAPGGAGRRRARGAAVAPAQGAQGRARHRPRLAGKPPATQLVRAQAPRAARGTA